MLISQAIARVRSHVDDENGARWSAGGTDTIGQLQADKEVDVAIALAASECVSEYASNGGERLDILSTLSTDTDGLKSLDKTPIVIQGVSIKSGDQLYPIKPASTKSMEAKAESLTIVVRYVPEQDMFVVTGDPDATAAGPVLYAAKEGMLWGAMDAWICAVAAKMLLAKDAEPNNQLDATLVMLRNSVLRETENPSMIGFPTRRVGFDSYYQSYYRWSYISYDEAADKERMIRIHKMYI